MSTDFAFPRTTSADARRAPGLRFVGVSRRRAQALRPAHGVPLFVGFGRYLQSPPLSAPPSVEVSSAEHFRAWVEPSPGGFLEAAVNGFFANGGQSCAVLPVGPVHEAEALVRPFAPEGPLEDLGSIDLVCVPDAALPFADGRFGPREIQAAVLRHCQSMGDRFAILDAVPAVPGEAGQARIDAVGSQSHWEKTRFGALYFPWLQVAEGGRRRLVPPCGHVAGVYARTDARTGVHKAPANEVVEGVLSLEANLDDGQHGRFNNAGVNCIRSSAGRGIRVMGARTLSGQSDWLYVPVARIFTALVGWLKHGLDDVVFESQTPALQRRVERRLADYCFRLMAAGALAGRQSSRAFFVKCDAENNPPESRNAGRLVADVGLAPAIPAEFVVVRITHDASGIAVTGL